MGRQIVPGGAIRRRRFATPRPALTRATKVAGNPMTQADSVHSTPPLNTSVNHLTAGLDWLDVRPDASLREIFRAIGSREAKEEIDRLLRFLDETDRNRRASARGARKEDHCALRNISALLEPNQIGLCPTAASFLRLRPPLSGGLDGVRNLLESHYRCKYDQSNTF